ncbi:MAG: hypothetical protein A2381_17245 [Bdellovibrionales bacterium RIFOXYB1_FULL_37_110]|nr:MAG: hypothetical protein A2181_08250 [Bdellovibrionales bacterium RIFOXYA1_FULL_38_20]OFZ50141.1 MAG: hypothetical protein A2417_19080 [Bdellovibrionales bacterium RIFOXYC1_FULL_37_79]OFZ60047.1 MAG: hypothetical protein A2381_17245 [Bdellovibrionales bacterium RIFOXYB1_FULL_37_110]OFZ62671.1 MAG: hypothetical protein A2577_16240 [Bdellovibrionales bacterium RIFOXYD1_FULL_36_51]
MFNSKSINDRLKNYALEHGIKDVEKARIALCLERVIARLVQDNFLYEHLIFGGGFVLYKETNSNRYTRDVDAVISGIGKDELILKVNENLNVDLNDGFWFGNPIIEELKTESGYGGLRFKIQYKAGLPYPIDSELKKLRRVHLDISIGVNLEKIAKVSSMNSTLDIYDQVEWKVYPIEFICAEKIHCLLMRKDLNTRGKDVYDLDFLLDKSDQGALIDALKLTFKNRDYQVLNSFESIIKSIDSKSLEQSFNKSQFKSASNNFTKCWANIVLKLQDFDRFFSSK